MADLNDFEQSISDMTEEQLTEMLRKIRLDRRTPTKSTSTKGKAKKAKSKEPKINLEGMSPEMAAKLLEQLEEGKE